MDQEKGGSSKSIVIDADVNSIMKVLLDFESYPEWMTGVVSIEVLKRDKKGRGTEVKYKIDAVLEKLSYVLKYSYKEKENKIYITYVSGDLDDVKSSYTFEPLDEKRTDVTYYFDVSYSLPKGFRGPVVRKLLKQVDKRVMKSSLNDLKSKVEYL